ncbi:MAG: hypothetical protein M5U34_15780 [Chloroflexi bacterium]|nr:hypothetical protein [Chloroflexota bacterium]
MTQAIDLPQTLYAEQEHAGLRAVVVFAMAGYTCSLLAAHPLTALSAADPCQLCLFAFLHPGRAQPLASPGCWKYG